MTIPTLQVVRVAVSVSVPPLSPLLDAVSAAVRAPCGHVNEKSHQENVKLCQLLEALVFRVTSEKTNGLEPTTEWLKRFVKLVDSVSAHVNETESSNDLALILAVFKDAKTAKKLRADILKLSMAMEFVAVAPAS